MNAWMTLLVAAMSGSAVPWLLRHARRIVTGESAAQGELLDAEARKLNIESDGMIVLRLYAEIERLDRERQKQDEKIAAQDAKIGQIEMEAATEKATLEKENRQLRMKVTRLENRIAGLEKVFQIGPIPPDMQAALDQLKDVE